MMLSHSGHAVQKARAQSARKLTEEVPPEIAAESFRMASGLETRRSRIITSSKVNNQPIRSLSDGHKATGTRKLKTVRCQVQRTPTR